MDKADCIDLMGYRIIAISVSLFGWGPARGTVVQAYTKVVKRFFNGKINTYYE